MNFNEIAMKFNEIVGKEGFAPGEEMIPGDVWTDIAFAKRLNATGLEFPGRREQQLDVPVGET